MELFAQFLSFQAKVWGPLYEEVSLMVQPATVSGGRASSMLALPQPCVDDWDQSTN